MNFYQHPTAVIDPGASIGAGSKVWHFAHVCSGAEIGKDCILGQNTFIADNVRLGDHVKVQNNVSIYAGTIVEDDVFLGPSAVLTMAALMNWGRAPTIVRSFMACAPGGNGDSCIPHCPIPQEAALPHPDQGSGNAHR